MNAPGHEGDPQYNPKRLLRTQAIRPTSLSLPLSVDAKLTGLIEGVVAVGAGYVPRKEMVAMIIALTDLGPEDLLERLHRYRTMTVGELSPPPITAPPDKP